MPMLFHCASNLALGAALAWVMRRNPAFTQSLATWPLLMLAVFEALLQTPVTAYLMRFHPHWATSYMFDPQIFPHLDQWLTWLACVPVALNFAAAWLGYALVYRGVTQERRVWARLPAIIVLDTWAIVIGMSGHRLLHIGEYDTFWQGHARTLLTKPAGITWLVSYACAVVFVLWLGRRYGKTSPDFLQWLKSY
jgi:hypothetical protein